LNGYPEQFFAADSTLRIEYLEMEKNIISFYRQNHPRLSEKIHFTTLDPIKYLIKSKTKYDLIFIDVPDPTSLFLNRFYTKEFFQTVKKHFQDENSVFICSVSNSANFLIPELAKLNGVIYQTLKSVFPKVVFIPASKCLYAAGSGNYISHDPQILTVRMKKKHLSGKWFNRILIFDICNATRTKYFEKAISRYRNNINLNLFPKAYLLTILFWTKHLDLNLSEYFLIGRNLKYVLEFIIFLILFLLAFGFGRRSDFKQTYNIISVSFVAFIFQLLLIYLTQIYFGFAYLTISVFTISFMLGLSLGFLIWNKFKVSILSLFLMNLALTIILFLILKNPISIGVLYSINFFAAVLEGLILAGNLSEIKERKIGKKGRKFYFLDTLGATLGGSMLGIILIPLFGIGEIIFLLMFILLGNIGVRIIGLSAKKLKLQI
jgi:spermidine synthase